MDPQTKRSSAFGRLTMVMNAAGTALILIIAVAVNLDILGRDLLNAPIPGVTEFIGLSIVAIVFLQMANTLREDRHVANDMLLVMVASGRPRLAQMTKGLYSLIGAVLMALVAWFVLPIVADDFNGGFYRGTAGVVEIPTWPFMALVLLGAVVTAVQYALLAVRDFRSALRGDAR